MSNAPFRLAEFLPYQLSVASNAVSNRIAAAYHDAFGLKVTEWRVMAMLGDAGGLTQRELTEKTLMDKVAVNRACKVLESRELAVRLPNLQDGRSHHLELTETGRAMHDKIVPMAREIESSLLESMSDDEQQIFRDLLEKLRLQAG
ncbi:MarR family winged helix-turn-helix transcriptional regulator [Pontixanthobacter aquaemixtae]|uniref:MarR family transcriptional regulator n=1 Tax=Pontixanthobacter aquaemixtae TaxID=1958940 RepID=A0A844ZRQ0_9SPHN|nr:MarR family winged helix-turn-helix transcriptional regulator [Pontixanthobacter aquaemixtae]MXO89487.1 MarR family transcriptional regulator [Pontixanthobacter aquaemixtae]